MEEIKEIRTRNELADYIGVPRKKLSYILYVKKIENLYESFKIPKRMVVLGRFMHLKKI